MASQLVLKLLEAAEQDAGAAERLLSSSPNHAAFWAYQATESLARAMCTLEDIPDINVHDVARIAEQLPDSNLFKTNLLCLAHLSSKATDTLWVDRTEATQVSPAPRNIKTLINRIKTLHDEMHRWLPAE